MSVERVGNILIYPNTGKLLFATDFHGQLEDFRAVTSHFQNRLSKGEDIYLLFAGDFVHGPAYTPEQFPDYLGDFHTDQTPSLLQELSELLDEHPNRVHSLLGNHEHAHIGGPATQKFHHDPNEVQFLEARLGDQSEDFNDLFRSFALIALTPCAVMFSHGAPQVQSAGFNEIATVSYEGHEDKDMFTVFDIPILGELLWMRCADDLVAEAFFDRMVYKGIRPRVSVYGHDIVREGFCRESSNQIIVSTSFGLHRANKTLCEVDLSGSYTQALDFQQGRELIPLYDQ